jgi:hypothetical protein
MGVEAPAVVAAFDLVAVEVPTGERHAPVGAGVLEGEGTALRVAANDKGDLEEHGFLDSIALDAISRQGPVPETGKHQGVGGLALGGIVEHWDGPRVLQGGEWRKKG